jgi:hypothetical protein
MHEISCIARDIRMLTVRDNLPGLDGQTHFIDKGNFEKERRDIMVTIRAAAMHS